jgi:hypothetical protein
MLNEWFKNTNDPYPNRVIKNNLAGSFGLTYVQVNNFLWKKRKKLQMSSDFKQKKINNSQKDTLISFFSKNRHPGPIDIKVLSKDTGLVEEIVYRWFVHQRHISK